MVGENYAGEVNGSGEGLSRQRDLWGGVGGESSSESVKEQN